MRHLAVLLAVGVMMVLFGVARAVQEAVDA